MADESKAPPAAGIDFYTFLVSLGSSAFIHLGDAPHPESPDASPQENLVLAKQTIDILGLIESKTKGNLTQEEEALLENLLTDLRLRYFQKTSGRGG
jgi:hypothetical protein